MTSAQAESNDEIHKEYQVAIQEIPEKVINVDNKICPVSGDKINEKTKATYEYEGKIYNS